MINRNLALAFALILAMFAGPITAPAGAVSSSSVNAPTATDSGILTVQNATCGNETSFKSTADYRHCLATNTNKSQVLGIIHQKPSEVTQKQKDRVYAVYPAKAEKLNLTKDQETKITDWMTWDTTGIKPGWYSDSDSSSGNSSSVEKTTVTNTSTATPAALNVEQERWADNPVRKVKRNGTVTWLVYTQYAEISLKNIDHRDVTGFGVREDAAILTYDKQIGRYVLNSQGTKGTFHLWWTVSEGNQTHRYTAVVSVEVTDYVHVQRSTWKQTKSDAENYTQWYQDYQNHGDPDVPVQDKHQRSMTFLAFVDNPFSALSGQFTAILTLLAFTPGGWLFDAILFALFYFLTRGLYRTIARYRKQLEDVEDVERREEKQHIRTFKQVIGGEVWADVPQIDDHQASALERELGPNLYTGLKNFWQIAGIDTLKRMYLEAMDAVGYRADIYRDREGNVESIEVFQVTEDGDGGENAVTDGGTLADSSSDGAVSLADLDADAMDAITWDEIDQRVFSQNPDISAVDTLIAANSDTTDDVITEMNLQIPEDFQDRHEVMTAIGHFLEHVLKSDFTDENGVPREERGTLNNLFVFTTTMDQCFDVPLDLWWRAILWNAENLDANEEIQDVLDDVKDSTELESKLDQDLGITTEGADGTGINPGGGQL